MDTCPNYEVYTIHINSIGATSNASFVGYMNITLRNVIKAELLSASFHANAVTPVTASAYYLNIEELKTKFNDRTVLQHCLNGISEGIDPSISVSNVSQLTSSLVCFPLEDSSPTHRTIFNVNNYFPVEMNFIEPIRQIEKFTVNFYSANGSVNNFTGGPTYLTFRITCAKPNVCQY